MTSLCKYIKTRNIKENIIEYYGELLPHNILMSLEGGEVRWDFISENLMSHDKEKIQSQILKKYSRYIKRFEDLDEKNKNEVKSFYIHCNDMSFSKFDEFRDLLNFFNYFLSDCDIEHDILYIEPTYPKKISIKDYHNVVYYFTDNDSGNSILKSGLRCKKSSYREYPSRIFFYLSKTTPKFNSLEIMNFVNDNCNEDRVNDYGWCCLKIDLNRVHCDVYNDEAIEGDNTCFTYNNIPSFCIKKIYDSLN